MFQYKPVSSDDLATAVQAALARTSEVKGQRFTVNGTQTATLNDMVHFAEKLVNKE
jgi:nucleoside-diphosphate-sugar epimerase